MNFKHILRKLWKNKLFTLLNILGLSIGISACMIVFKIVNYEFSVDQKHPNKELIYKLISNITFEGKASGFDGVPSSTWDYVQNNLPQVELTVPLFNMYYDGITIKKADDSNAEFSSDINIYATNKSYFELVPYTWLAGNKQAALNAPNQVVLTESRAKLYFPNVQPTDIIGREINYDDKVFAVSGVVKDLDYPSSFQGVEFIQVQDAQWKEESWSSSSSNNQLFIKLKDPNQLPIIKENLKLKLEEMTKVAWKDYDITGYFEPVNLSELHFHPNINNHTDKKIVYGMIGIGIFLLLLASINYINLSTALIPSRAKEIGIRKTLGQRNGRVTLEFISETFLITGTALLLSWPLSVLFEHFFKDYFPGQINEYDYLGTTVIFLLLLILGITILSSLYPTYLSNKVQIIDVLKSNKNGKLSIGSISLRKALIVFQFVIAQLFVIATVVIGFQLKHLMSTDLGFDKQALITLDLPYKGVDGKKDPYTFKKLLLKHPEINSTSLGHFPLSSDHWGNNVEFASDTGIVKVNMPFKMVDDTYMETYGLKLMAGRALTLADTSTGIILNEKAISGLGFKSPQTALGQTVTVSGEQRQIAGIVKNFHTKNLHMQLEAAAFLPSINRGSLGRIAIKLNSDPKSWNKAIETIQKEWQIFYPNTEFNYKFYDERIKNLYEQDYRFSNIINLSSIITILISCLGLIGLVTISTSQRTKEIGIRKVLGSTVSGILGLLSKDYIKLIFISILVATPIAWWAMNKWLENFAFKINLSWWLFIVPAVVTIIIALFTMSLMSIKAAKANPVDSLRDE
ncbi:ABC transporter permease [Sphingobacterium lactis]|uniref:ABC transporter permease n=1 Tax=Sphingobacterium lactis TaxID=797291 RepID=UPI003F81E7E8